MKFAIKILKREQDILTAEYDRLMKLYQRKSPETLEAINRLKLLLKELREAIERLSQNY